MNPKRLWIALGLFALIIGPMVFLGLSRKFKADENTVKLNGDFLISHIDDFSNNKTIKIFLLKVNNDTIYTLQIDSQDKLPTERHRIHIEGTLKDNTIIVPKGKIKDLGLSSSIESAPYATGTRKVAVILVKGPGDEPPETQRDIEEMVFTGTGSVANFYKENSFNKLSLEGDVYNWVIESDETCHNGIPKDLVNFTKTYDDYIWVKKKNGCANGIGGLSYGTDIAIFVGQAVSLKQNRFVKVFSHELGHNLGLMHANAQHCTDELGQKVSISQNCQYEEYGGAYDTMNAGDNNPYHFSVAPKAALSWIEDKQIVTIDKDGEYKLKPLETNDGNNILGLRIKFVSNDVISWYYYIEYRSPNGFDSPLAGKDAVKGVTIRWAADHSLSLHNHRDPSYQTMAVDATPETDNVADREDQVLTLDKTIKDPENGISFKTISVTPQEATVEIKFKDEVPPTIPTDLKVSNQLSGTTASQKLSWTASTDAGGVSLYEIRQSIGTKVLTTKTATDTTVTFDNIPADGTTYSYEVRAKDKAGNYSAYSAKADLATPDRTGPSMPTNLKVTNDGKGTQTFSWKASTDLSGVDSYDVRSYKGEQLLKTDSTTQTSFNYSSLDPATEYFYDVRAKDKLGNFSDYSAKVSSKTNPLTPPASPTNLKAKKVKNGIRLTWRDNSNNEDGFVVERSEPDQNHFTVLGNTNKDQVVAVDKTAKKKKIYYYRIRSYRLQNGTDKVYSEYSNTVKIKR